MSDRTGAGGIVFGHWRHASVMLAPAPDDTPAPSQPEGSGTFRMQDGDMEYCRWEGGTIDASSRRLGADEGRLGGADGDETCRQQSPQNCLWVFYHVLEGKERAPRGCRAHVEGKRPKI